MWCCPCGESAEFFMHSGVGRYWSYHWRLHFEQLASQTSPCAEKFQYMYACVFRVITQHDWRNWQGLGSPLLILDLTGARFIRTGKRLRTRLGFELTHGFIFWMRSRCLFNSRSRSRFVKMLSVMNFRRAISNSCAAATLTPACILSSIV